MAPHQQEKTKPLSWVWSYFKPTEIAGVRYNVCHAPITPGSSEPCLKRMIPDKSGGTKSMGNHLERKHRLSKSDPPPLTPITLSLGPSSHASSSSSSSKRRLNRDSLIHGIARLVVASNLPVQIANNQQFIDLLHLCNPLITRSLLAAEPHLTLTRSIHHKFKLAREALQSRLDQLTTASFSLSATISTPSNRNHSVLAVVLHWVSDPPCLKSVLLAITQLSRKPSSSNIALAIAKTLKEYGLQNRIFSLTIDNVPDLNQFSDDLVALIPQFKPHSQLIGCMARLINHAAEIALDAFQPSNHLPSDPPQNSDIHASHHFNLQTVISRLQDLALLLRQSLPKAESFTRIVAAVTSNEINHPIGGLSVNHSNTSWVSTYQVLSHAYQIKEAIQIFCIKESGFAQYHIHDQEWDQVRLVVDFLKPVSVAANVIACDKACDMITATPTYCWLLRRLNKVRRNYEGREIPTQIKQMLEILNEFSEKTSQKPVHIFGMILDPRIKMSNFEEQPPTSTQSKDAINNHFMSLEEIRKAFYLCSLPYSQHPVSQAAHNELCAVTIDPEQSRKKQHDSNKRTRSTHHQQPTDHPSDSDSDSDYETGQPRIFKKKPKLMIGLEDEITNYLEMECEESNCNPIEYWRLNSNKFPSLSRMAKDFLAIQSSAGLAFKATGKFIQLFEASVSSESSVRDPNILEPFASLSNSYQHSADSHFINSTSSCSNFHSSQQRTHHTLIIPDHSTHTHNDGPSSSGSGNSTHQRLITHSFPILHPSSQIQNKQEFHVAFPNATVSASAREPDILVDDRAHLTHPHLREESVTTNSHHNSIQDRITLGSSSNPQHLMLIKKDREDDIPTAASISNNNHTLSHRSSIANLTNTNAANKTGSTSVHPDLGDVSFVDKLDSFATLNPLFCQLCHIVCLYDWCFLNDIFQI